MKKLRSIIALVLCLSTLCSLFISCNNDKNDNEPKYADYTVRILDEIGLPISQVIIKFTAPDGTTKNRMTDDSGIAVLKNTLLGEYKITIDPALSGAEFKTTEYTMTKDKTMLDIVVRDVENTVDISGEIDGAYAYNIGVGNYTNISVDAENYTYFIFMAREKGIYTFTLESEDANASIGYFGMPYLFYKEPLIAPQDGEKSFEIVIQDIATPYVIGVKGGVEGKCNMSALRTADAPFDPQFAEWINVEAEEDIEKCVIAPGKTLKNIDVTREDLSVSLGEDGRYYTSDGDLVYIRITSDAPYLNASLAYICGFVGGVGIEKIGGYIYDENGNFIEKRNYNNMIESYMEYCDETHGVVELTEELAEAIKLHGESKGWFDINSVAYIFRIVSSSGGGDNADTTENISVNPDLAWLFLCCTVE